MSYTAGKGKKYCGDEEGDADLADRVGVAGHPAVRLAFGTEVGGDAGGQRVALPHGEREGAEGRGKKKDAGEAEHKSGG